MVSILSQRLQLLVWFWLKMLVILGGRFDYDALIGRKVVLNFNFD